MAAVTKTDDEYGEIRFHNGLAVWAGAIVIVGYPEIKAAVNPPDWADPHWHTISSTVGHLEQLHHWVALIVGRVHRQRHRLRGAS